MLKHLSAFLFIFPENVSKTTSAKAWNLSKGELNECGLNFRGRLIASLCQQLSQLSQLSDSLHSRFPKRFPKRFSRLQQEFATDSQRVSFRSVELDQAAVETR